MPPIPQRVKPPASLIAIANGFGSLLVQRFAFAAGDDQRGRLGRGDVSPHQRQAGAQAARYLHLQELFITLPYVTEDFVGLVFLDAEIDQNLPPKHERRLQYFTQLVVDTGTDQPKRMSAVEGAHI